MSEKPLNENTETFKRDIFDSEDLQFEVSEADGEVDGKHVIGRVRGTFFVPDGVSRNNRFYPKDLWEGVLADNQIQDKLKTKRMLGTVGHDLPIDDKAVRDGLVSHIVTKLEIGEANGKSRGIGEALILDTPAGRSLNTLLRAGSKLFTSSRAFGKFQGQENGVPKVDKSSYKFDTFDFVLDPGFAEANPKLVEQLEINNTNLNKGDTDMDKELLEKVVLQSANLQTDLTKAIHEAEESKEKLSAASAEVSGLKARIADLEVKAKADGEKLGSQETVLEYYKKLGTPKEIEEALKGQKELIAKFEAIGSPEKILEANTKAAELLNQYKLLGTPAELDKAVEGATAMLKDYKALGTPKQVQEALEGAKKLVESYKEFGTIEELNKVFEKMNKMASGIKNENITKKVKELSAELRVTEEAVKKLLEKGLKDEEIRDVLKNVSESVAIRTKYKAPAAPAAAPAAGAKPVNENAKPNGLTMSRAQRIMGNFTK